MRTRQKFWTISFTAVPQTADRLSEIFQDDAVALTVIAPPRVSKASVEALFNHEPDVAAFASRMAIMSIVCGVAPPTLRLKEIPALDWLKKVAEDFPPLPIARWVVHGAQHRAAAHERLTNHRLALQIDATSAFGTGEHPTTRGCLILLDRLLKRASPRRMLDVGCGSGILAMAFAKTCAGMALGVELDPDSVLVAQSNMRINGLSKNTQMILGNGYRDRRVRAQAPYDLIMANIFARPLSHMAKDLKRHLKPGGTAILSGILAHQTNQVIAAHRMQKLYLTHKIRIGEWSVLALKRRGKAV